MNSKIRAGDRRKSLQGDGTYFAVPKGADPALNGFTDAKEVERGETSISGRRSFYEVPPCTSPCGLAVLFKIVPDDFVVPLLRQICKEQI